MQIENSIALVTGANRGVGRQYVAQLIERGAAKVYAAARNIDSLSDTVALAPERVVPLALDVTDTAMIEAAARTASDVTLLINNAGSLTIGGALDVSDAGLARDMAVNNDGRGVVDGHVPARLSSPQGHSGHQRVSRWHRHRHAGWCRCAKRQPGGRCPRCPRGGGGGSRGRLPGFGLRCF